MEDKHIGKGGPNANGEIGCILMHFIIDKWDLNESAAVAHRGLCSLSDRVDGVLDFGLGSELGGGWGEFVARDS